MQFISQGDIVVKAFLVFISIMLFASVYLFLIKALNLSSRASHARRFLRGLSQVRSWEQVQDFIDQQTTIKSFSRVAHHIMAEKKALDGRTSQQAQASGATRAVAQHLIELEAARQAGELKQGLNILAAVVWAAPLAGLVAIAWHGGWHWLQSAMEDGPGSGQWSDGLGMMQLGLVVASIALVAYLYLVIANRIYLTKFVLFRQVVEPLLAPGGEIEPRGTKPRHDIGLWLSLPQRVPAL